MLKKSITQVKRSRQPLSPSTAIPTIEVVNYTTFQILSF